MALRVHTFLVSVHTQRNLDPVHLLQGSRIQGGVIFSLRWSFSRKDAIITDTKLLCGVLPRVVLLWKASSKQPAFVTFSGPVNGFEIKRFCRGAQGSQEGVGRFNVGAQGLIFGC